MKLLVVVDMQNDFIDGSLGTKEAQSIVAKVKERIKGFKGRVLFTRDTHGGDYLETQEGKNLPVVHCLRGEKGWEIADALKEYVSEPPFDKPSFGSIALAQELGKMRPSSVTLIGLCTDICVISNALIIKAFLPETKVSVDASCCAGVTPESHLRALEAMKACQVEIINE